MADGSYRNRLLQFVIDALGKSQHGRLVQEALESLGSRLERLGELSSKGVHDSVTREEARRVSCGRISRSRTPCAWRRARRRGSRTPPACSAGLDTW